MNYPRNPYYENTDVRNRKAANEDILGNTQYNELTSFVSTQVAKIDAKTLYHVGFALGQYFPVFKKLWPELKLYGCEFDPMFLNFGHAHFQINDYVESLNIVNFKEWQPSQMYDIVMVEDWFYSLDRDSKKWVFELMASLCQVVMIFEKWDDDFTWDRFQYTVERSGDKALIKPRQQMEEKEWSFAIPEQNMQSVYDGLGIPEELRQSSLKEDPNGETMVEFVERVKNDSGK